MVKLGFVVEGATEKIILERSDFFQFLDSLNITYIPEVIDAKGNGNLLPHNITHHIDSLHEDGATHIFILTDLDEQQCITNTKKRINVQNNHFVIVCVKVIEAWFLSDTEAMRKYFNYPGFNIDKPETIDNPFEEIKATRKIKTGKGLSDKRILANTMVHQMGFSILKAAQHPNCNSARYFLKKIAEVAASK